MDVISVKDSTVDSEKSVDVGSESKELCISELLLADVTSVRDCTVGFEETVEVGSDNTELGSSKLLVVATVTIGEMNVDISLVCDGDMLGDRIEETTDVTSVRDCTVGFEETVEVGSDNTELGSSKLLVVAAVAIGEENIDVSIVCDGNRLGNDIMGSIESVGVTSVRDSTMGCVDVGSGGAELCNSKLVLAVVVAMGELSTENITVCVGDMLEKCIVGSEETVDVTSERDSTVGSKEIAVVMSGNTELCNSKLVLEAIVTLDDMSVGRIVNCDMPGGDIVDSTVSVGIENTELCTRKLVLSAIVAVGEVSEELISVDMLEYKIVDSKETVDVSSGVTELCNRILVISAIVVFGSASEDRV